MASASASEPHSAFLHVDAAGAVLGGENGDFRVQPGPGGDAHQIGLLVLDHPAVVGVPSRDVVAITEPMQLVFQWIGRRDHHGSRAPPGRRWRGPTA